MQPVVDAIDLTAAGRHELLPQPAVLRIAGVQSHRFGMDFSGHIGMLGHQCGCGRIGREFLWLGIDQLPHQPVEPPQFDSGVGGKGLLVAEVLPPPEDHSKLRTPVAEVVIRNHLVATKGKNPGQRVADHGGADVPHMHRLGDIGRTEIDDDLGRLGHRHDPQAVVLKGPFHPPNKRRVGYPQIDKPGPNRLARRVEQVADIQPGDDLGGHLARLAPSPLGQCHRHGAGIVTKLRVGRHPHLLRQARQLLRGDRHHASGGQALQGRVEHLPQGTPKGVLPGQSPGWVTLSRRRHRVASAAGGSGTRRASLQSCSRSK